MRVRQIAGRICAGFTVVVCAVFLVAQGVTAAAGRSVDGWVYVTGTMGIVCGLLYLHSTRGRS